MYEIWHKTPILNGLRDECKKNEYIERGETNSSLRVFGFSSSENERKIIELFISCSSFANCARDFHHFAPTSSCLSLTYADVWCCPEKVSFMPLQLLSFVCVFKTLRAKTKRKIVQNFISFSKTIKKYKKQKPFPSFSTRSLLWFVLPTQHFSLETCFVVLILLFSTFRTTL